MTTTKEALKLLEDIVASIVILSLIVFIGAQIFGYSSVVPPAIGSLWFSLYSFVVLMSATKLYGKKIYNTTKGFTKNLFSQEK